MNIDDARLKAKKPKDVLADIADMVERHSNSEPYVSNTIYRIHDTLHRYLELTKPERLV